jgi:hypothetical protein
MAINDGGPAFPIENGNWNISGGMSLRDYFAGQALDLASHDLTEPDHVAERAYRIADAMIVQREKEST